MKTNKPFAVFDIDGTLVRWQLYHAVVDALAKQGVVKPALYSEVREARMAWKRRSHAESFKAYEERLVTAYKELLSELSVKQFEIAATAVFSEYKDQVYIYTRDLITQLKDKDYVLFAISNSQQEVVTMIADYYGFDDVVGAVYERRGDHFSGQVTAHMGDKDVVLEQLIKRHGVTKKGSIAVGDSGSDIAMLAAVERPIAFNPERRLLAEAEKQGWSVVIERKNVIYELRPKTGSYVVRSAQKEPV